MLTEAATAAQREEQLMGELRSRRHAVLSMDPNATAQMDSYATARAELSQVVRDLNECLVETLVIKTG